MKTNLKTLHIKLYALQKLSPTNRQSKKSCYIIHYYDMFRLLSRNQGDPYELISLLVHKSCMLLESVYKQ